MATPVSGLVVELDELARRKGSTMTTSPASHALPSRPMSLPWRKRTTSLRTRRRKASQKQLKTTSNRRSSNASP